MDRSTIYRWVDAGELDTVTMRGTGRRRIRASELRRFVEMGGSTKAQLKDQFEDADAQLEAIAGVVESDKDSDEKIELIDEILFEQEEEDD